MTAKVMLSALLAAALMAVLLMAGAAQARSMKVTSTAYCLRGTMANGTFTRQGSVAMNMVPLGTRIKVSQSPTGRLFHTVRDRIGWGTQLDFWVASCGQAHAWGRRTVRVKF
jgi:3D (Asp-Asp-Asp) domain-containing protein